MTGVGEERKRCWPVARNKKALERPLEKKLPIVRDPGLQTACGKEEKTYAEGNKTGPESLI